MSPEVETPFLNLGSKPILAYALSAYESCPDISGVVVVVNKSRIDSVLGMSQMYGFSKVQKIVAGGTTRQTSVASGLRALEEDVSIVSVHDSSRPWVSVDVISETVKAAKRYGSGVAATPLADAAVMVEKGLTISQTLTDGALWALQTPQTYRRDILEKAYAAVSRKKATIDDDTAALALIKEEVHLVAAKPENMKIRTPLDFNVANCLMNV